LIEKEKKEKILTKTHSQKVDVIFCFVMKRTKCCVVC